jgi:diguanylate cyclase (GGDEF)-like protein/PAS domain S-box-containing protein
MDKPHSGQIENGRFFELQQQNEFLKRQLAYYEAARERLDEAGKEIQEKERALRTSEEKYRRIVETTGEGFIFFNEEMKIIDANSAYCAMVGYSREEIIGRDARELATDDHIAFLLKNPEFLIGKEYRKFEGTLIARDGGEVPVLVHGSTLRDERGEFLGHMAFVTDVTEIKLLQKQLTDSERRYRGMFENAVQGMFMATLSGEILSVNPAYLRMLGYDSLEELMASGKTAADFFEDPNDLKLMIEELKEKGSVVNYEFPVKRRNGSPLWVLANIHLLPEEGESGESVIEGIAVDNTARKLAEDELRRSREMFKHMAVHDNLTGLYNTRHLYRSLEDLILESRAGASPFSLIFMDMDNFKRIVDSYGHLNGSQALKEVADTIRECINDSAFGVAYGGDEFVVVLPGLDRSEALKKASKIRSRMKETVYLSSAGHAVRMSASFGLATFPDDASDLTSLLALADKAMFRIKEGGKDAIGLTVG